MGAVSPFCHLVSTLITFNPVVSWYPQQLDIVVFCQYHRLVAVPDRLTTVKYFSHILTVRQNINVFLQ
jgi:hypothetical protein